MREDTLGWEEEGKRHKSPSTESYLERGCKSMSVIVVTEPSGSTLAGGPLTGPSVTLTQSGLCPVHRGFIAMNGRSLRPPQISDQISPPPAGGWPRSRPPKLPTNEGAHGPSLGDRGGDHFSRHTGKHQDQDPANRLLRQASDIPDELPPRATFAETFAVQAVGFTPALYRQQGCTPVLVKRFGVRNFLSA